MQFASDVTDKLHLPSGCNTDCSGSPNLLPCRAPVLCGPRTYEQRLRVQRNRISATYTGTGVTVANDAFDTSPGEYLRLNDGGNPAGIVLLDVATFSLVNSPVYRTPPSNPVSAFNITQNTASETTFDVTVKSSNCCSC